MTTTNSNYTNSRTYQIIRRAERRARIMDRIYYALQVTGALILGAIISEFIP